MEQLLPNPPDAPGLPEGLDRTRPILIFGPTASGKSELALRISERFGGVIVNADASQVFDNWSVLTARPDAADLARAPHHLYGHLPYHAPYSAGQWLRDIAGLMNSGERPIIVGGTGLYFLALTEGLVDLPQTPPQIRAMGDALRQEERLGEMIAALDPDTQAKIDLRNPMRVQRAWEVQRTTGLGLAHWHAQTPPPILPLRQVLPINVVSDPDWLGHRIARRFEAMLAAGALDEARANLPHWDPDLLSMKAIGAAELIAHLKGACTREEAAERATIATRQFAKRQRTWARARMVAWTHWQIDAS